MMMMQDSARKTIKIDGSGIQGHLTYIQIGASLGYVGPYLQTTEKSLKKNNLERRFGSSVGKGWSGGL